MAPPERDDGPRWATGASNVDSRIAWTADGELFSWLLRGDAAIRVTVAGVAALVVLGATALVVGPALLQLGAGGADVGGGGGGGMTNPAASNATTPTSTASPTASPTPTSTPSPTPTSGGFGGSPTSTAPGTTTETEGLFDDETQTQTETETGTGTAQTRTRTTASPTPTDDCDGLFCSYGRPGAVGLPWTVIFGLTLAAWARR